MAAFLFHWVVSVVIFSIVCLGQISYIIRSTIKKTYNPLIFWKNFREQQEENDRALLLTIIIHHNIDTKEKLREALRHYQTLMPKKLSSGMYLAIFALSVSIIPHFWESFEVWYLIFTNSPDEPSSLQTMISFFIVLSIIVIASIFMLISLIAKFLKSHLYHDVHEDIEGILSYIYFNEYDLEQIAQDMLDAEGGADNTEEELSGIMEQLTIDEEIQEEAC